MAAVVAMVNVRRMRSVLGVMRMVAGVVAVQAAVHGAQFRTRRHTAVTSRTVAW